MKSFRTIAEFRSSCRGAGGGQGYACRDARALPRYGLDRKFPTHQAQPLPHADQAEPAAPRNHLDVEAHPGIGDAQVESLCVSDQFHLHRLRAAVPGRITQGFLHDSEQTQCDVFGNEPRDLAVSELRVEHFPLREVLTKALEGRYQTKCVELGRVKLVRQAVDVGGDPWTRPHTSRIRRRCSSTDLGWR